MKVRVDVVRYGSIWIEAEDEAEAMRIADHQYTDSINWSEDWTPVDAWEDDSLDDGQYITEEAF